MIIGMTSFAELIVEDTTLGWLESLGNAVLHSHDMVPNETAIVFPSKRRLT